VSTVTRATVPAFGLSAAEFFVLPLGGSFLAGQIHRCFQLARWLRFALSPITCRPDFPVVARSGVDLAFCSCHYQLALSVRERPGSAFHTLRQVEAHNLVLGYNPRSSFTEFNFAAAFFGLRLGARLNIFFPTTAPALFFGQVLSSLVSVRINHCLCCLIL
jgi:hypothetical protein